MSFTIKPRVLFILEREGLPEEIEGPQFPPIDMYISQEALHLEIEIPGVEPQEVSLTLESSHLLIEGTKKEREESHKPLSFIRMERFFGPFKRYVELPRSVKSQGVKASYKKGVLYIQIPLQGGKKTVEIEGED
jgi:HSP20 family protein